MPEGHLQGYFFSKQSERPEKISVVLYIIKGGTEIQCHNARDARTFQRTRKDRNTLRRRNQYHAKGQSWYRSAFSDRNRVFKAAVTVRFDKGPRISTSDLSGHDCNGRYAALRQDTSAQLKKARVIPDCNMQGHRSRCFG